MKVDGLRFGAFLLLAGTLVMHGCGSGNVLRTGPPRVAAELPASVSPASIPVPPMIATAPQSAAEMNGRRPKSTIAPPSWTQLPGAASFVAVDQNDGSLWALSTLGPSNGVDKYIYHYVSGSWVNLPGAAMRITAAYGSVYAVTSAGGIYGYYGGHWNAIAGGASDITYAGDGSIYVVSNVPGGPHGNGIWRYYNSAWTQIPGAGVRVAGSWDMNGDYPGGITGRGLFVVNAHNDIFHYDLSTGFTQIAGAATELAPTPSGGLFALSSIDESGAHPIFFDNLATSSWAQQPGAAVSIATDGTTVYAVGSAGGIYSSPVTTGSTITASQRATYLDLPCTASPAVYCYNSGRPQQTIVLNQANGFAGPFTVLRNERPAVATVVSPGPNDQKSVVITAQGTGKTVMTFGGYGGADISIPVYVTTMPVTLHLGAISGAQTLSYSYGGPEYCCDNNGHERPAVTVSYPAPGTYTIPNMPAAEEVVDLTSKSVHPQLTTFVHITVFNGTINVVDKNVPVSIAVGQANPVDITIP